MWYFLHKHHYSLNGTTFFYVDVAEVAFNRCVTTNEGTKDRRDNQVHATSDTLEVDYNYEFLDDFQDKFSPDR